MAALVTLAEAKTHLRVLDDDNNDDISLKIDMASAIVLDWIKQVDVEWTPETVPWNVKAAVLLTLGSLFADREAGGMPDPAKALVGREWDPAFA